MKSKYFHRYYAVDSIGQIHIESNNEMSIMGVGEQFNYEVRKRLPRIIIGSGRNKKIIKNRYTILRHIDKSSQLDFFKMENYYGKAKRP